MRVPEDNELERGILQRSIDKEEMHRAKTKLIFQKKEKVNYEEIRQ
jgi:hypothetical protein